MVSETVCDLGSKKCVPCEGGVTPLTYAQAQALLAQIPGWDFAKEGKAITRRFTFPDFKQALAFVNKIGAIAEADGHHPDLMLGWGYVEVLLWTHAINGLHDNDFIVASKINGLAD